MNSANQAGTAGTDKNITILYLAQEFDLSLLVGDDGTEGRPRVYAALGPTDAVREVINNAIDCVVTENRWYSNDDGVPFVTAVKRAAPRVPVVIYADDGPITAEEQLLEAGADEFYWQTTNPAEQTRIREEILTLAAQTNTHQPNRARSDELEQLLQLSDDAFAVHDFVNDRNIAKPGLKNIAPSSQSAFTITDAFEMIYEGDRESVLKKNEAVFAKDPQAFDSLTEGFGTFSERVRVRKGDGSIAHCVMRGAAVFDGDRLVKMYNSLTDVTPEQELNWKLRSEEMLLESGSDHRAAAEVCQELVAHADCAAAWITQSGNGGSRPLFAAAGEHERFVTGTQNVACVESLTDRVVAAANEPSPSGDTLTADHGAKNDREAEQAGVAPCEHAPGAYVTEVPELAAGYLVAAPIRRDGILYGVLTAFRRNSLTETFERLLDSLATSLAFRHEVGIQRRALRADSQVSVDVRLGTDHVLGAVSEQESFSSGTRLRARELERTGSETTRYLVSVSTPDGETDTVVDAFNRTKSVTDITVVGSEDEACTLTALTEGESLEAMLVPHACVVREVRASDAAVTATIDAPPQTDVRTIVETIQEAYPEAAFDSRVLTNNDSLEPIGIDQLTAKQEEALRVAVIAGFFDRPQRVTASDVAEMVGVSRSTALHHIRNAEQRLFADIL